MQVRTVPASVDAASAVLTARPLIAHAWATCCRASSVRSLVASSRAEEVDEALRSCAAERLVVLADLPIVAPNELTSLRAGGATVILLAANRMNPALRIVLAAGSDGLLTTHDSLAHMAEALEHGVAGNSYASPSAARLLLEEHSRRAQQPAFRREGHLSVRELQVLGAMVDGLTTKGTASRLGVAVKTVEAHRARLFAHLGVRNQREAITAALTDPELNDSLTGRPDIRT